jgi:dienelactone hydrolase
MSALDSWTRGRHRFAGMTHDTYRTGTGPGVIVIHEMPGITPKVVAFADEVVAAGFTVVLPHLFGRTERELSAAEIARVFPRLCVSREFTVLAAGRTSPVAHWLRSLARTLHAELGGPGVGAVGMCFTGGFALAMMVDDAVAAPVLAQPSLPMAVGRRRGADLGLSPDDLAVVQRRAAEGCSVLGLRYSGDRATGTRFDTLRALLGDRFVAVELDGSRHCTLTEHRQQRAVDRVLEFLTVRLGSA